MIVNENKQSDKKCKNIISIDQSLFFKNEISSPNEI